MTAAVVASVALGAIGLCAFAAVALFAMRTPETAAGRAWRMLGLTACSSGAIATFLGGVVGFALGLGQPSTAWTAAFEGSLIAAVPGLVLGALVGVVLSWDAYVHSGRPA
jgi:hypothetical protein